MKMPGGSIKPETRYRQNVVNPFLAKLKNLYKDSIQQKGRAGSGDYYLCLHGLFIYLEIKWYKGKLSKIQSDKMWEVKNKGRGIAICAHPGNWKEVKDLLCKLDKGERVYVEDEVQRLNSVPIPNGPPKTKGSANKRAHRLSHSTHGRGSQEGEGPNFEGI